MLTRSACRAARGNHEGRGIVCSAGDFSPSAPRGEELLLFIHFLLPVAIGWSFTMVMKHAAGVGFSDAGLILLLCGIGAAYSLDRLVDSQPRASWLVLALSSTFALCGGVICFILAKHQPEPGTLRVVLILAAMSLLYTRLKRLPLVKTILVAFAWIFACATLPGGRWDSSWLFFDVTPAMFFLVSAGCILCDLKDEGEDRRTNIPSLPVLLGARLTCLFASGLAVLAVAIAWLHHHFGVAAGGVLLAVAAQFPSVISRKPTGAIVVDSILAVPGILIALQAV